MRFKRPAFARSIRNKLLAGFVLTTIIIAGIICYVTSTSYRAKIIERYEYVGMGITSTIANRLNGDQIMRYLNAGEPDGYYDIVLDEINTTQEQFDALYIYVCIPEENDVLYIWSDHFPGEETIGFTTGYAQGGKEWMQGRLYGREDELLKFVDDPVFGQIATAAYPVHNSQGRPVALVCVDFLVDQINTEVLTMNLIIVTCVFTLMLIFIVVYSTFANRHLVRPIEKLTTAAKELTENLDKDHAYKSDIHTQDELEELSLAFEKMDVELRDYIVQNMNITAAQERINADLDTAANIQESQLPSTFPAFPGRYDFDIYASMTPAKTVGGDFYDFFLVDEDHLALVMADVSGKGIPASLFMMISKLLIQSRVMMGESPAEALNNTNAQLMQNNAAHQFVTVWLAVIDLKTGKGIAANAGHEHPAIRRANGKYELVVYKHSPPVATMKRMKFKEHEFELFPGDSLFVYTDGVAEATDSNNELFGAERMLEALNKNPDAKPKEILKNVMDGIDEFVKDAEQFDDITMLSITYNGPDATKPEEPEASEDEQETGN
jgi:sigma-B regulation protein RsbU (phosphoserine phosphatase)